MLKIDNYYVTSESTIISPTNRGNIRKSYKEDTRMGHIQHERLLKSKMASSDDKFTFEIVLRFGNELNKELCRRFILIYLYKSSTITGSLGKVGLEILVAKLATNFQDLVAKVKNLVALAPVLGAILRPEIYRLKTPNSFKFLCISMLSNK